MQKIKLYHLSNKDIKGRISIKFFNDNLYTFNDYKISKVKRAFYYLDLKNIEYRFKNCVYLYVIEIDKKKIYNLNTDDLKLKNKFNTINDLLIYLKNNFLGAYYSIGNLKMAVLFKGVKFKSKVKR